jgi:putative zinc finger/helix-turn-helix YgiT family protein
MIRCSVCNKGKLVESHVEHHDVSGLVGLDQVFLVRTPALRCDTCGAVSLDGTIVEAVTTSLARLIVRQEELRPKEVRFLRELLGMTQAELAERLGITRVTVARWETAEGEVGYVPSLALRTLAAWQLDDPALAREIGLPTRKPGVGRTAPPYELSLAVAG